MYRIKPCLLHYIICLLYFNKVVSYSFFFCLVEKEMGRIVTSNSESPADSPAQSPAQSPAFSAPILGPVPAESPSTSKTNLRPHGRKKIINYTFLRQHGSNITLCSSGIHTLINVYIVYISVYNFISIWFVYNDSYVSVYAIESI